MYCLNPSLWHDRRRRIGFGSADCRIDRAFLGDQVPIATACLHPGWSQAKFDTARWATRPPNIPVLRLRHMRLDTMIGSQAPNRPENDHERDSHRSCCPNTSRGSWCPLIGVKLPARLETE